MNIAQIMKHDVANGPGIRLSIFISGCRIHCKGCFQPETWDFNYGRPLTDEMETDILTELGKPEYAGVTFLGGEPLEPENQPKLLNLISKIRYRYPEKSIWCYTGNEFSELMELKHRCCTRYLPLIFERLDVLVAGPFIQEKKDLSLAWCGSSNQQVIDMKATRDAGYERVIVWKEGE